MELPTPNLPLLRKVLCHIDEHPEEWDQSDWGIRIPTSSCGTAYCVAGHALNMSGHQLTFERKKDACVWMIAFHVDGIADGNHIQRIAQRELGLTPDEATRLFYGHNSRADIQVIAQTIAQRAGEVL